MADTALSYSIFAVDKTGPGTRSAGNSLEKLGGVGKKIFGALAIGGAALGAVSFAKGLIADARESAKVQRMTDAVVKSTGMSAHIAAGQVGDLSTAISNKTGVDDEAIQSGQNLLLTFTNIRNETGKGNDIFNQASMAITDMTAALNNGDVSAEKIKGSSVMLGKALNDPIKGITALSRAGVSFTDAQKEQITTMVKSGDTMGAQKIILGELKKEFGGAAAASSDPAQKAAVAWGNLREQLGGYLLPVISKVATFLSTKVIPAVSKFFDNVAHGDGAFASFRNGIGAVVNFVRTSVLPVIQRFGAWFTSTGWPAIKRFASALWADLQPALHQIVTSFNTQLKPALEGMIQKFKEAWPTIQRVLKILGEVAGFILTKVVPVLIAFYAKYLANVIKTLGWLFKAGWKIIGFLVDMGAALGKAGQKFGQFVGGVKDKFGDLVGFVKGLPGKMQSALSGLFSFLPGLAKSAINGVIGMFRNFHIPGFTIPIPFAPDISFGGASPFGGIPYLAKGGNIIGGGMAMVGERGPEMLNLPKGAQVTPLSKMPQGGGAQTIRVVIDVDGADGELKKMIKKMVRVDGGGDVQVAFGKG